MATETTAYDAVVYPSTLFPSTHPDRLAAIARLHGLDAPPLETARVLELGGGDGINTIAMAAAYPDARFLSFDLSSTAALRGARVVASAGMTNIQVGAGDICDAAQNLNQQFDYIIAHGVYAWVPEKVREAIMVLVGRVLSPNGVAFISYNTLPGGHLRRAIREMALHHVRDIEDADARAVAAQEYLRDYARPREGERPLTRAMRNVAKPISEKRLAILFHDELGEIFEPQSLTQVVDAASPHGLAFLNDATLPLLDDGFPMQPLNDRDVVAVAQASDYEAIAFFHSTLLIREGRNPDRSPNFDGFRSLYIASDVERVQGHDFRYNGNDMVIGDDVLAETLASLSAIWPDRIRVGDVIQDEERLMALLEMIKREIVTIHSTPLPGVRTAGERPCSSPLCRVQIANGSKGVFTLDHRVIAMHEPGPRALMEMLDGTRDRETLARDWAESGFDREIDIDAAIDKLAAGALLIR